MEGNRKNAKRTGKLLSEKGFYIVLLICAAVIGVCAWLLWFSTGGSSTDVDKAGGVTEYSKTQIDVKPSGSTQNDKNDSMAYGAGEETALYEEGDTVTVGSWNDEISPEEEPEDALAETSGEEPSGGEEKETAKDEIPPGETEESADMTPGPAFVKPLAGEVSAPYSVDKLVYNKTMADWRAHDGIDIAAAIGTKVKSVASGTVEDVFEDDMFGTTVVIDHGNGVKSCYSNLAKSPTVEKGDTVAMGDVIGAVGDTAIAEASEVAHLHLSMTEGGESVDPKDYIG